MTIVGDLVELEPIKTELMEAECPLPVGTSPMLARTGETPSPLAWELLGGVEPLLPPDVTEADLIDPYSTEVGSTRLRPMVLVPT